jgi:hypothetical protein
VDSVPEPDPGDGGEQAERRISQNLFLKLKGIAAKSKFHYHTMKKTYSTYSVPFCFRRIYTGVNVAILCNL